MCGIAGFIDFSRQTSAAALKATVSQMASTLRHRGPDDAGVWTDAEAGIALGHQRLSIIDLSPTGHQPMVSPDGRYVIVYNGEAYNFPELRRELEACERRFRGRSDTEVILHGCAEWGVAATVNRLVGMFAFALWDRDTRTLSLVRDRMGIKPIYWGWSQNTFLFGSELKALRAHPDWSAALDRNALAAFVRFNYIPAPHSIYQNIQKLAPGQILTLRPNGEHEIDTYWSTRRVAYTGLTERLDIGPGEAIDQLETLLRQAVGCRMVSDVPLGALLSGGIDSSTIVALMQIQSNRPIKTFSIGFDEADYDEAQHAKAVAKHLGTDHSELYVGPDHARDVIPRLASMYDEPFADSSQIPTFLVSELARQEVTVALSGDGGDELFGGYPRYYHADHRRRVIELLPRIAREGLGWCLKRMPARFFDRVDDVLSTVSAGKISPGRATRAYLAGGNG